jgi:hypothetical protein
MTAKKKFDVEERINIATDKGRKRLLDLGDMYDGESCYESEKCWDAADIEKFLKTMGESPLHFNKIPVYTNGNNLSIAINNNRVYGMNDTPQSHRLDSIMSCDESAILVTTCKTRHGETKGNKALLLVDADDNNNNVVLSYLDGNHGNPFVSFECAGAVLA